MVKVVVTGNPNPEFQARLDSLMKEHAANVEIAFIDLHDQAMRAAFGMDNLNKTYREWVEENCGLDPKLIDAEFIRYPYPEGSITGRLSGYAPDPQELVPRRPADIRWPTAEELSGKTGAGLRLADADYSHLEERVLAHYPNINLGKPYEPAVYTEEEHPVKAAVATALAAAALSGGVIEKPGIPDRVCINPSSPWFWPQYKSLGVKIDGEERKADVHEFCVSEGWAMIRARNEKGQFKIDPANASEYLLERMTGKIEPYFKRPPETVSAPGQGDYDRIKAAEAKRARKAMKRGG